MKVIHVTVNNDKAEKEELTEDDFFFLGKFFFPPTNSYDLDHTLNFYLLKTNDTIYELFSQDLDCDSEVKKLNLLYCEIESGELNEIAQLMLSMYFYSEREYSGELVSKETKIRCLKDGVVRDQDLNIIIQNIDFMEDYFSNEYKLYGVHYDKEGEAFGQEIALVYGFSNAVELADSIDADNVYFGCYDEDDGQIYFKEGGYEGSR